MEVKRQFPEIVRNGFVTMLNEVQATAVKLALQGHHNLEGTFEGTETELEMLLLDQRVNNWKSRKIAELSKQVDIQKVQIAELEPRAEAADALMKSSRTMSITECAKYFGLHPRTTVFPYLRELGYLTSQDLPTQAAIDSGYMVLKKTVCGDNVVRAQTMVLDSQLDTWRKRIVPQIAAWEAKKHG
jgi:phage antirepressor YoqD-like protein